MRFITGLICLGISLIISFTHASEKCVAFFYANKPIPDDMLYAYDWIVVIPENKHLKSIKEKFYTKKRGKLIAYLSIGEQMEEHITQEIKQAVIGKNPNWNTKVMDVRNPAYKKFLLEKAKKLLLEFDGVFLDTLDSYKLALKEPEWKSYETALRDLINQISSLYPDKVILINRGFEILNELKKVDGVVVESLFKEKNEQYRNSVIEFLKRIKESKKVEVVLIEYEKDKSKIEEIIKKAKSFGFIAYVSPDINLESWGYSSCKIVPRKIVLLYDSSMFPEPQLSDIHKLVQLPLEYLGFVPVLVDVNEELPEVSKEAGYVGIVSMNIAKKSAELDKWLYEAKKKGLKLFFLKDFPFRDENREVFQAFGVKVENVGKLLFPNNFKVNSNFKFYEAPYAPEPTSEIAYSEGLPVVEVMVEKTIHRSFVITEWGGYALGNSLISGEELWVFNPFEVFRLVFKPDFPVPDITTENGNRILTAHIDGDAFFGISEINPKKRTSEIIRDEILKKYKIPHTVSIIEAEIAPWGLYPKDSALLEEIAKSIYKLENVEPASHSFTHPFTWNLKFVREEYTKKYGYNLPVKGYELDFKRKILGSIEYINERLLKETGKRVKVFLWTGMCNPTKESVRLTYLAKVYNINGGNTTITNESPLYISEYAHKVLDFRQTAIIKLEDGFLIKNDGELRTLRIPKEWGFPDLERSEGVVGFKEEEDFFYVHLDNSGRYILRFRNSPPPFWLEKANGQAVSFEKGNKEFTYKFSSYLPLKPVFKNNSCRVLFRGKTYSGKEILLEGEKNETVKVLCP